jgi:hypothetical protein
MLDTLLDYLRTPFIVLSGTPVTTLTLVTAIVVVAVARLIGSIIGRSADRIFAARGLDQGLRFAIGKMLRYAITTIGVIVALSTIGINTSAVMAGGAVLLVGIGFGLQKLAENFISGLLLLIERPVRKGDFIDVAGVLGTVEDIGLRATHVVSRDGLTVIVPNASLITNTVINHSQPSHTAGSGSRSASPTAPISIVRSRCCSRSPPPSPRFAPSRRPMSATTGSATRRSPSRWSCGSPRPRRRRWCRRGYGSRSTARFAPTRS